MEKMNLKEMIESVISDFSTEELTQSTAIKIHMIARTIKNENFSNWVNKELKGYKNDDIIPEYRILRTKIVANVLIDNGVTRATLKNHDMPLSSLGKSKMEAMLTVKVVDSIISIVGMSENINLAYGINEYERQCLATIYENSTILGAHKPINPAAFKMIVYNFKTKLIDLFMDFNDNLFNDEIDFDLLSKKKDIQNIVNHYINAGVANVGEGNIQIDNSNISKT